MKRWIFLATTTILLVFLLVLSNQHAAQASTSTSFCIYGYRPDGQYPCPAPTATPFINGTLGMSAYTFEDGIGMNIHFGNGAYGPQEYILALLQAMNIHHIRDGLSIIPGNYYAISSFNLLQANGIYADLIATNKQSIATTISEVQTLISGEVESLEGPNELDICCRDTNWIKDDQYTLTQSMWPSAQLLGNISVIGPVIGSPSNSYAKLGSLAAYEDYGNTHDYQAGFYPEVLGWGGPGYCGEIYATIAYNLCNAKQSAGAKPVAATEFGYQVALYTQNDVDELAQGTYTIRQIIQHYIHGIPKSYIYALLDTGGQTFGLIEGKTGRQRPAFSEISGFMQVLRDSSNAGSGCVIPVTVTTSGVRSFGLCKSTGENDLVLWQPVQTYNTNTFLDGVISPISASVVPVPGFTPSSVSQWSYDPSGVWSNNSSVDITAVPVTDRPSIIVLNGPSPTPLPLLPTPIPVQTAVPTPTPLPTPTPVPTAKPTSVALVQASSGFLPSNQSRVNINFGSKVRYGDSVVASFAVSQFNGPRIVNVGPYPFVPIDQIEMTSQFPLNSEGLSTWIGYIPNGGATSTVQFIEGGGDVESYGAWDLSGSDSSAQYVYGGFATTDYNVITCPTVTVARPGSMVLCAVATKDGFSAGGLTPPQSVTSGWTTDWSKVQTYNDSYGFHLTSPTTIVNQVVPGMSAMVASGTYSYSIAETIVVQPPL
jgi:hypothetical protein